MSILCDNVTHMNTTNENKLTLWGVGFVILILTFSIGTFVGTRLSSSGADHPKADTTLVTEAQFAPFWKAWKILNDKYVAATSSNKQDQVYGAIKGLAASEGDPYTVFFPPVEAQMFQEDISGNFEGVGMEIGIKDGALMVVAPIKGSPAERAGVKTGDIIARIGSTTVTTDVTVEAAVKQIRGPKGTSINILFLRQGTTEPIEKKLVRDIIDIPTLDTEIKQNVFVIKLYSFTSQSADLFRNALREFVQSGMSRLVIDLRGNPGGYLDAAVDMASWFLPAGKIVVTEDFGKNPALNTVYRSKGYDVFGKDLKLAILVNGGSASASEILAGALSEHKIAKLVGTKTFGKGSVQELIPITSDTSLKVTIARWLTPLGHNLSKNGLDPDVEVKISDKDAEANLKSGKDPQLDKAIEILNK